VETCGGPTAVRTSSSFPPKTGTDMTLIKIPPDVVRLMLVSDAAHYEVTVHEKEVILTEARLASSITGAETPSPTITWERSQIPEEEMVEPDWDLAWESTVPWAHLANLQAGCWEMQTGPPKLGDTPDEHMGVHVEGSRSALTLVTESRVRATTFLQVRTGSASRALFRMSPTLIGSTLEFFNWFHHQSLQVTMPSVRVALHKSTMATVSSGRVSIMMSPLQTKSSPDAATPEPAADDANDATNDTNDADDREAGVDDREAGVDDREAGVKRAAEEDTVVAVPKKKKKVTPGPTARKAGNAKKKASAATTTAPKAAVLRRKVKTLPVSEPSSSDHEDDD
jgi:hypothetical protein